MLLVPVIDLKSGVVVRGIAGKREEYRPLVSSLVNSCEPVAVARAIMVAAGGPDLYVADLDAIQRATPDWETIEKLQSIDAKLWLDAGARCVGDVHTQLQRGIFRIVLGLETIASPNEFERIVQTCDCERLIFSLDLKNGEPICNESWKQVGDVAAIAAFAFEAGIRRMIVLDLARVGMGNGIGTEELCGELLCRFPDREIFAGGGVRGQNDIDRLHHLGLTGALVATMYHS